MTWIVVAIFLGIFALITFEVADKAILALIGAILMIALGVLDFESAIRAIQFESIVLLLAMMLMVEVARESGIFSWIAIKIAKKSKGNPLFLFLCLTLTTAILSMFLDNVTTIVIIVPITIELLKGMDRDPKLYVILEILFSNLGGDATLIGDSSNILIGGASKLSFNEFLINLGPPALVSIAVITLAMIVSHWKHHLKPINGDLEKLFSSQLLIRKIEHQFIKGNLNKRFLSKCATMLLLTIISFFFSHTMGISVAVLALAGTVILLLWTTKETKLEVSLKSIEWGTLLFFSGLFVLVKGVEEVGALNTVSNFIISMSSGNYLTLLLILLWVTGFVSMIFNNVPFITLMIPIIFNLQTALPIDADPNLLWWAMSMGACFGGNGTLIGSSAGVVGTGVARKHGVNISFLHFLKYGIPLTLLTLTVASFYLTWRVL